MLRGPLFGGAPLGFAQKGPPIFLTLSSLWLYVVLASVCVAGFCVQLPLFVVTYFFDRNRRLCGAWFRFMARTVVRCCWLWRFEVDGSAHYPVHGGAVVVSNHESHCDAFLISFLGWEMKWLAKRSLFRIPFIGWLMALAGDVALTRGDRASGSHAMQRMRQYLRRGMPVFFFPEGTRAVSSAMLPFKPGAFRLALEAGVPVIPLAVAGTRTALAKHGWKFGRSRAKVRVGIPIDPLRIAQAHTSATGIDLRAASEALSREALQQIVGMRRALQGALDINDPPHT